MNDYYCSAYSLYPLNLYNRVDQLNLRGKIIEHRLEVERSHAK